MFLSLWILSCSKNSSTVHPSCVWKDYTIISGYDHRIFKDCQQPLYKDLEIDIKHEDYIDLHNYHFTVSLVGSHGAGYIYQGLFREHLLIKNISLCSSSSWTFDDMDFIVFEAIDIKKKYIYFWRVKNTYALSKVEHIYVVLKSNGEYKIKFDNDLFYENW